MEAVACLGQQGRVLGQGGRVATDINNLCGQAPDNLLHLASGSGMGRVQNDRAGLGQFLGHDRLAVQVTMVRGNACGA
jgi:hypothetical protein